MSVRHRATPVRKDRRGTGGQHFKMYGYVQEINGRKWWATIRDDEIGDDLFVEMDESKFPLPADINEPGYLFSLHRTKAGRNYIFWLPPLKITSGKRKRNRRYVTRMMKVFEDAS